MSSVASSPILTSAASTTAEGVGGDTALGAIRPTWATPATQQARITLKRSHRRRTGSPYERLSQYVRLQCHAAVGQFLRGLAYGTGLSLAGTIVLRMRGLW